MAAVPSITLERSARQQYLLRLGDTCLVLGQRLAEWCGHAPILEEDLALANIALDLIGQARAVLTLAGRSQGADEDQLAFLRDERDYFNLTLAELPRGDFAFTMLRIAFVATLLELLWKRLAEASTDAELAALGAKAAKEARYHREHASAWVVRLARGTDESRRRCVLALDALWRFAAEWFDPDAVDEAAAAGGLGPRWSDLGDVWRARISEMLDTAGLAAPEDSAFRSRGREGLHSEHMGYLLAEMQQLQRAYPGGAW